MKINEALPTQTQQQNREKKFEHQNQALIENERKKKLNELYTIIMNSEQDTRIKAKQIQL